MMVVKALEVRHRVTRPRPSPSRPEGLPLLVRRRIGATALQSDGVIDDVTRTRAARLAGGRTWMRALERVRGLAAALDAPMRGTPSAWFGSVRFRVSRPKTTKERNRAFMGAGFFARCAYGD